MKKTKYPKAVLSWLAKAKDDLNWAQSSLNDKIYYGCCFICQQAVEKALKSFLLFHNKKFPKIHDLTKLANECSLIDKNFKNIFKQTAVLSNYYIEARYPDLSEFQNYNSQQAKQAYKYAKEIIKLVEKSF